MPRTATAELLTPREAAALLRISVTTLKLHWRDRDGEFGFTDHRTPGEVANNARWLIHADEVAAAVAVGGGTGCRAKAAVYRVRKQQRRLPQER